MAAPIMLEIDASELDAEINRLRNVLTPARFNQVMYRIFQRTGGHVRRILQSDLPHQYYVKPSEVGAAVKRARVTSGALGVGCVIPITGAKKTIGGGFSASGGAHGWASLHRRYRVKSRIVKAGQSTLPMSMGSYGGMPPFRNLGSRLGGVTFTRAGKDRFPIMKVVGIAIPQMPMNRSEAEVQADITAYLRAQMEHEFQWLMMGH